MDRCLGLNRWARSFLDRNGETLYTEKVTRTYPDGREEVTGPNEVCLSIEKEEADGYGINDDDSLHCYTNGFELHNYTFSTGERYTERVQKSFFKKTGWLFSESTYFLALKDGQGNWVPESLWTEEGMQRRIAAAT